MLLDDVRFVPTVELENQVTELERNYIEAQANQADTHTLNKIWQRIREIKTELAAR